MNFSAMDLMLIMIACIFGLGLFFGILNKKFNNKFKYNDKNDEKFYTSDSYTTNIPGSNTFDD